MQTGIMNLNDPVRAYAPELTGSQWKDVKMLNLATYTSGGLTLQLPDSVTDQKSLWQYYQQWQPQLAPREMRNYSNASIELLGALAVKISQLTFEHYMTKYVFLTLKLTSTFITVPELMLPNYAWGYQDGQPVRVTLGMLVAEAYGVKSTSKDMVRYM